MSQEGVKSFVS